MKTSMCVSSILFFVDGELVVEEEGAEGKRFPKSGHVVTRECLLSLKPSHFSTFSCIPL